MIEREANNRVFNGALPWVLEPNQESELECG
jgi:hypothetical protein